MGWKDWLAGATFAIMLALAVTTVVIVVHHERHHHTTISQQQEETLQRLCYENPGNGGC